MEGIGRPRSVRSARFSLAMALKSFKPDIVLNQLGSNDLTGDTALRVGSSIDDFVRLLHDVYHVKVIY